MTLYHEAEGGDIGRLRQAPPGADQPYPNLADVPPAAPGVSAEQQQSVRLQLAEAKANPIVPTFVPAPAANSELGGLTLPTAAPPVPDIPGIIVPPLPPAPNPVTLAAAPARPALPDGPPILLAFAPGTAILSADGQAALAALATRRGAARVRVGGFGEGGSMQAAALQLALRRARRIADALTAAGVPPDAISVTAAAAGSGGFAQLVYE